MLRTATILFFVSLRSFLYPELHVDIESTSGLLINGTNGKVLFTKNASKQMYPASCTKIAFALYAIKFHKDLFDTKLVASQNSVKALTEAQKSKNNFANIPSYVLETDASHMGIKVGEEFLFSDLLLATMIVSADDASNMIAEAMGNGSIEKCVDDVNRYMTSMGCKNTHFTNPHGLHHPEHVTTAEDLALLCREAMKEPLFREMVLLPRFQRPKTNKQAAVLLKQSNRLLLKDSEYYYPSAVGVKTGRHRRAGYCLVAQAEKDGRCLVSVTLQGKTNADRFKDTIKLFETGFQEEQIKKTFFAVGNQTFSLLIEGGTEPIATFTQEPLEISYYPSEKPKLTHQLMWSNVRVPITKGTSVGELVLFADNEKVNNVKLYAANDVQETFFFALKKFFTTKIIIGFIGLFGVLALLYNLSSKR